MNAAKSAEIILKYLKHQTKKMNILKEIDLKNVLFIDIETVPQFAAYEYLEENWKKLWSKKMNRYINEDVTAADVYERAGFHSEFGKIVCISAGCIVQNNEDSGFRVKSYYGEDEKNILIEFSDMLNKNFNSDECYLCAHNGKDFDYPYISRRCLINGIPIPSIIDVTGRKPWEIRLLDTMDLWRFGDYKNFASLDLLAAVFGLASPKTEMDGSMVGKVFWLEKNLEQIKNYCQKDVVTMAQLLMRFKGMELLKDENVVYIN